MIVLTAIAVMIAATLIQHLGLAEAVSQVIIKVSGCNQCFVFWTSMMAMLYLHQNVVLAVVLSILMSYASNWFILLLIWLQRKYTEIYGNENENENEEARS